MSFYKFRPISKFLIENIVSPSLYFSKPADLNDPFDCHMNLKGLFEDELFLSDRRFIYVKDRFHELGVLDNSAAINGFSEHGILSVSKSSIVDEGNHETLMWSHYADEHKGVRLKYNLLDNSTLRMLPPATIHVDIFYDKNNDFLRFLSGVNDHMSDYDFYSEFCNRYLTTKHPAWEYEQEYRFVTPESGVYTISPNCLEEVCFGLNTSASDIKLITELATTHCGCHVFKKKMRGNNWFNFIEETL